MHTYEITIEMPSPTAEPNGDWYWCRCECADYHDACDKGLTYAASNGARLHHIERVEPRFYNDEDRARRDALGYDAAA